MRHQRRAAAGESVTPGPEIFAMAWRAVRQVVVRVDFAPARERETRSAERRRSRLMVEQGGRLYRVRIPRARDSALAFICLFKANYKVNEPCKGLGKVSFITLFFPQRVVWGGCEGERK